MRAALSDEVKQAARELRSQGLSIRKIAAQLGISVGAAHENTRDVKAGKAAAPKPPEPQPELKQEAALPSAYDKFKELGASVGVQEPLLSATSDFVFRLGADDVKAVYDHLRGIIRVDLARSWAKLYGGYLGQELKGESFEAHGDDQERFSVVGQSIVRDPEGVSYNSALRELEVRLRAKEPDHKGDYLDDLERVAKLFTALRSVFGGNSGSTIQLKEGSLSIQDFIALKGFEVDSQAKAESDKQKLAIATGFKDLIEKATRAMANTSKA